MWDAKGRGSADAEFEVAASEAERQASKVQLGASRDRKPVESAGAFRAFGGPWGLATWRLSVATTDDLTPRLPLRCYQRPTEVALRRL